MARPKKPSTSTPKSRALQRSAGRTAASQRSAQTYYGAKPTVSESGFSGLARAAASVFRVGSKAAAKSSRAAETARASGKVQRPGGVGSQSRAGKSKVPLTKKAGPATAQQKRDSLGGPPKRSFEQVTRKQYGQTTSYPRYKN
jgi:hypothetical protein